MCLAGCEIRRHESRPVAGTGWRLTWGCPPARSPAEKSAAGVSGSDPWPARNSGILAANYGRAWIGEHRTGLVCDRAIYTPVVTVRAAVIGDPKEGWFRDASDALTTWADSQSEIGRVHCSVRRN
jgi:hypothetical protein